MLLLKSEQVMKEEGVTRVSLTTDFDNNEQAVGFITRWATKRSMNLLHTQIVKCTD